MITIERLHKDDANAFVKEHHRHNKPVPQMQITFCFGIWADVESNGDLGTQQCFGWKEYDYMRTKQNLKSNEWQLRDKMWVAFVPRPEQILHYGEPITIVQRLKKI